MPQLEIVVWIPLMRLLEVQGAQVDQVLPPWPQVPLALVLWEPPWVLMPIQHPSPHSSHPALSCLSHSSHKGPNDTTFQHGLLPQSWRPC